MKMEKFNSNIVIVNHFSNLIQQIDIEFEASLEKHKEDKLLRGFQVKDGENFKDDPKFKIDYFDRFQSPIQYSESTKVVDYLSKLRMKAIEKLKNAQEEILEQYSLNSSNFNFNNSELTKEQKLSQLFAEKFCFQVKLSKSKWIFNLFTFFTDFFIPQSDIDLLE